MKKMKNKYMLLFLIILSPVIVLGTPPTPPAILILDTNTSFNSTMDLENYLLSNQEKIIQSIQNSYVDEVIVILNQTSIINKKSSIYTQNESGDALFIESKYALFIHVIKKEYIKDIIITKDSIKYTYERCKREGQIPACSVTCVDNGTCIEKCPSDEGLGICGKDTVVDSKNVPLDTFAVTSDGRIYVIYDKSNIYNYSDNYSKIIIISVIIASIIIAALLIRYFRKRQ